MHQIDHLKKKLIISIVNGGILIIQMHEEEQIIETVREANRIS